MAESTVGSGSGGASYYDAAVPGSIGNSTGESVMVLATGSTERVVPSGDEP